MDSNYDHIKKQLSRGDSEVPPQLSWEHMEAGILQEMEAIDNANTPKKPLISVRRLLLGLALLLILLLIPFFCTREANPVADLQVEAISVPADPERSSASKQEEKTSQRPRISNEVKKITQTEIIDKPSPKTASAQKSVNNRTFLSSDDPPTNLINRTSNPVAKGSNSAPVLPDKNENDPLSQSTGKTRNNEAAITPIPYTDLLPGIRFFPVFASRSYETPAMHHPLKDLENVVDKRQGHRRHLGLTGSLTWWSMGFGDNKPERDGLETTRPSFGSQLTYMQDFGKQWSFSVGLGYQRLESRLDHTYRIDDYEITLTDTIIAVSNNLLTGGQTFVRGDVDLLVPAEVLVRHYNTLQLYQVPVTLGRWWQRDRWRTDIQLGASVNILTEHSGRTVYQGNVVDYSENKEDIVQSNWRVNALLRSSLSYQLTSHFEISSGLQLQHSLMNWSQEDNTKMYPLIFSLELGCRYSW